MSGPLNRLSDPSNNPLYQQMQSRQSSEASSASDVRGNETPPPPSSVGKPEEPVGIPKELNEKVNTKQTSYAKSLGTHWGKFAQDVAVLPGTVLTSIPFAITAAAIGGTFSFLAKSGSLLTGLFRLQSTSKSLDDASKDAFNATRQLISQGTIYALRSVLRPPESFIRGSLATVNLSTESFINSSDNAKSKGLGALKFLKILQSNEHTYKNPTIEKTGKKCREIVALLTQDDLWKSRNSQQGVKQSSIKRGITKANERRATVIFQKIDGNSQNPLELLPTETRDGIAVAAIKSISLQAFNKISKLFS